MYTETVEKQSGNFGGEVQAIVIRDTDSECSSQTSEEDLSIITENPNCKRNLSTLKKKQTNRKKKNTTGRDRLKTIFFLKQRKAVGLPRNKSFLKQKETIVVENLAGSKTNYKCLPVNKSATITDLCFILRIQKQPSSD